MKINVNKSLIKLIAVLILVTGVSILIYFVANNFEKNQTTFSVDNSNIPKSSGLGNDSVYYDGHWYERNNDITTLLILGIDDDGIVKDSGSFNNTGDADFITLIIIDNKSETYKLLQLNRDTMTDITILGVNGQEAGKYKGQLALSHTFGSGLKDSCNNSVKAVSDLLYGINIDHYLSFNMGAVPILNDLVGGVTVTIKDDFSQVDSSLAQGQIMTLRGQQALTYVRERKDLPNSTNLARMSRQREYMDDLSKQFKDKMSSDDGFWLTAYNSAYEYLVTDCSVQYLSDVNKKCMDYKNDGLITIDGKAVKGQEFMEYHLDKTSLEDVMIKLFYIKE